MRIRVRVNGVEGGATLSIGAEAGVKTESELVAAAATKLLGVDPTQSIDVSKAKLFLSGGDTVDVADLAADDTVYIAFTRTSSCAPTRRRLSRSHFRRRPGLSPLP